MSFWEFHSWKCEKFPKILNVELLKWSKRQFWGFKIGWIESYNLIYIWFDEKFVILINLLNLIYFWFDRKFCVMESQCVNFRILLSSNLKQKFSKFSVKSGSLKALLEKSVLEIAKFDIFGAILRQKILQIQNLEGSNYQNLLRNQWRVVNVVNYKTLKIGYILGLITR